MWPHSNARGGEVKFYHEPKRIRNIWWIPHYHKSSPNNNTPPNVYSVPQIKNISYLYYLTGAPKIKVCFFISILKPEETGLKKLSYLPKVTYY